MFKHEMLKLLTIAVLCVISQNAAGAQSYFSEANSEASTEAGSESSGVPFNWVNSFNSYLPVQNVPVPTKIDIFMPPQRAALQQQCVATEYNWKTKKSRCLAHSVRNAGWY